MRETLLISDALIKETITAEDALQATRDAFVAYAKNEAQMPPKVYLELPGGDLRAMPAHVNGLGFAGVKVVNVHQDNRKKGLPTVMATYLLIEPETGFPLAVMGATTLTALRTGAAGALSTQAMANPTAEVLAIIGAGVQSHTQLQAHEIVMPHLKEVRLYAPMQEELDRFREIHFASLQSRGITLVTDDHSVRTITDGADVIITVTPGNQIVLKSSMVKPGSHIVAIGADAPGKQEIDGDLINKAKIVVDDLVQAEHSGEINIPIREGQLMLSLIKGTLGEVLIGKLKPRESEKDITLFDSTGLAIQDAALAGMIYGHLKSHKKVQRFNLAL